MNVNLRIHIKGYPRPALLIISLGRVWTRIALTRNVDRQMDRVISIYSPQKTLFAWV